MEITLSSKFITGGFLTVIFIIIAGYIFFRLRGWWRRSKHGLDYRDIKKRWDEIEKMFSSDVESARKLALIEADKLLDEILKTMMMPGETLGERLKSAGYKHEGIREAWLGHKIRNKLVHESAFNLSPRLAREARQSFKKAFRSLGLL